jgi:hypothetical protein
VSCERKHPDEDVEPWPLPEALALAAVVRGYVDDDDVMASLARDPVYRAVLAENDTEELLISALLALVDLVEMLDEYPTTPRPRALEWLGLRWAR